MLNFETLKTLSTCALLVCVVVACKQTSSPGNLPTLKSPDGKFQITVPDDWTAQSPLAEGEIIKAANKPGDIAVVVAAESKTELASDMTIDKYAETVRDKMLAKGNPLMQPGLNRSRLTEVRPGNSRSIENPRSICACLR